MTDPTAAHPDENTLDLSIIAPAHNEEENIHQLVSEIAAVVEELASRFTVEAVIVNDGSTDRTEALVLELAASRPFLRVLTMSNTPPGKGNGQSAAFHAAFRAARGRLIAPLDADLQNPPDNIPKMLALLEKEDADLVQGDRTASRQDSSLRWISTFTGRLFRKTFLGDTIQDTGCSLRIMKREIALQLPLQFKGIHRYIPGTARRLGYKVVEIPVTHRARTGGTSKYGLINRAIPGLFDVFAVRWMNKRRRPTQSTELSAVSAVENEPPGTDPVQADALPTPADADPIAETSR